MERKMKAVHFLTGVFLMASLAIAMAFVSTVYSGAPLTVGGLLLTALYAFMINFVASLIIPAAKWGAVLSLRVGAKPESWKFILINTLVTTVIYVTIVSLGMTMINADIIKSVMAPFTVVQGW